MHLYVARILQMPH